MGLTVGQRLWLGWIAMVAAMGGTYAYVVKTGQQTADPALSGVAVSTESRRTAIGSMQEALRALWTAAQVQFNGEPAGSATALADAQERFGQALQRYRANASTSDGISLADEADRRMKALKAQIDDALASIAARRERRAAFERYLVEGRQLSAGPPDAPSNGSVGRAARRQYAARDVARQLQERMREATERVAEGNLRASPVRSRVYAALAKYEVFADAPSQRAWLESVRRWMDDSDRQGAAVATAEASERRALAEARKQFDALQAFIDERMGSVAGVDFKAALERQGAMQAQRQRQIERALVAGGSAVALLGLLTMFAARAPLRRLAKSTRAYVASDLSFETISMRNDEAGELQAAVRALINRAENGAAPPPSADGAGPTGAQPAHPLPAGGFAQLAFAHTRAAMLLVDARRNVLATNAALEQACGRTPEELAGQPAAMLWSEEHHDGAATEAMWDELERKGSWQGQIWLRHRDAGARPMWASGALVRDEDGKPAYMLLTLTALADVAEAPPDSEAGLDEQLAHALARARRQGTLAALLHIELEQFKGIDQVLGAQDSAQLMQTAMERLYASLRAQDLVLRTGPDRFTVLLQDMREPEQVRRVAEKILSEFSLPVEMGRDLEVPMRPAIGIALAPQDAEAPEAFKAAAETAVGRARAARGALYAFYAEQTNEQMQQRHGIESALRSPELFAQLRLEYEPRVFVDGERLVAAQALPCWEHPQMGLLSAERFLPLAAAESATAIEEWSLEEACRQLAAWRKAGVAAVPISVKLRRHSLGLEQLVRRVESTVKGADVDARLLELEWDAASLPQGDESAAALGRLAQLGVALSLDIDAADRAALGRARRLPLTRVKLGRALIDSVGASPLDQAMARATITLARSLGAEIVVGCVAQAAQVDFLRAEGCLVLQGPLYGAPLSAAALQEHIERRTPIARAPMLP